MARSRIIVTLVLLSDFSLSRGRKQKKVFTNFFFYFLSVQFLPVAEWNSPTANNERAFLFLQDVCMYVGGSIGGLVELPDLF